MLNQKGERELVYVVKIDGIIPIEGAERVEVAQVGGWRIMVRKDQFSVGDPAIYFEIDSKVPEREPFVFLESKHYKIKTQKYFKGTVISQGLLMAPEDFGWSVERVESPAPALIIKAGKKEYREGEFLTKDLGVTYYEPEDNARKASSGDKYKKMAGRHPKLFRNPIIKFIYKHEWGKRFLYIFFGRGKRETIDWPNWVQKTDEERIQNMPWILEDKSEWIATEKIDGTSTTATFRKVNKRKHRYYICSRNVVYNKPDKPCYYDFNVYTEMSEKYHFEEVLKAIADRYKLEWVTLQGESYGAGVQKRDYGMDNHDFMGFNLIFSDRGRLNSRESADIMKEFGIPWVPILDEHFVLPNTVEELLDKAAGKSAVDGGMREGLVFRSQDGSRSFKAVSNEFLLKYHS
ncbi:MAG: hypothetical protein IJ691_02370 [Lachnospiraceae bacterium]|nr:hypothetical protein [Lachnospiraceae bacterium]